jgi:hypothetical protein
MYKKDVQIQVLGPVGDIVEKWDLKGAFPSSVNFQSMDWANAEAMTIEVTLTMDYCILQF